MENTDQALSGQGHEATHITRGAGEPQPEKVLSERVVTVVRGVSVLLILAAILTIFRSLPFDQVMAAMKNWIAELGFWGPVVLTLMYVVATVLFVPGTILTLVAGAIFGLGIGMVIVSIGSTIGASLAFLIARYGARDRVAQMAQGNRHFGAIDRAIGEGGWKIVALLRLSPALPFNLQNYLYGLTPVPFWPYVLTSWIAMMPGTFLYVYLGHVTGAAIGADRERSIAEWAMLGVGLLATVVVTVYVTRLANRKLKEQVDEPAEIGVSSNSDESAGCDESPDEELATSQSKSETSIGSTIRLAAIAIVLVGVAAYVRIHASEIERSLAGMFGPPSVQMTEAYVTNPSGTSVDHSALDGLLHTHVDDAGWVDYAGMKTRERELDAYLDAISHVSFEKIGRDEKLALLINGYNAATLKLILENWPVDSIKDIPESQRWDAERWIIGGNTWSLNQIEHEQIRPNFAEPRIHFALVCAAVGCPPLRNEAYQGEQIDEQLQQQTEYVHRHATWFQFESDETRLRLTQLYKWYRGDFEQADGSMTKFAAKYSSELRKALGAGQSPTPDWLPYDWQLNAIKNKQPR
ncbi:VTT domain-containing protein [Aporhodopirellula aestuarii]|uniref:VTT domain-containing protein n=1 Tax=Aporhodopirellula aestuarii TaxID=2950107 RepID=A0ABT0TZZ0_9BACT|nr:VTT domain-containing protein [Aporhodopirellula aestuarii]MCM2370202.1 VTT domain-containing protein [Aporhodopirellula aestuarii]